MAYTTIDNPELYFQCKIWSGNNTDDTAITLDGDENMQPDFVWTKRRNASTNHDLWDAVRGALKQIASNNTEAEATISSSVKSFDSDGFTVGTNSNLNASGGTYVAWCWKEASGIFDIVSYTGNETARTISHSLSAVPKMIIAKDREDGALSWFVGHASLGWTKRLKLDGNNDGATNTVWNNTDPTSSVFSVGSSSNANQDGNGIIAYLFSEKQGYSKISSFVGNGSTDGSVVWCGFSPAFVLIKSTASGVWRMWDNKRDALNPNTANFQSNASDAEYDDASVAIDFLSSGFKARSTDSSYNGSGTTYVYMAFAEAPFVNSKGVPANAR